MHPVTMNEDLLQASIHFEEIHFEKTHFESILVLRLLPGILNYCVH